MTSRNRLFAVVTLPICAAILLAGAGFASAGDLNPPVGPVAPTHKTLTEVEPRTAVNATNTPGDATNQFRITQAGSYYLTGNITGVAGSNGIQIVASGVTLDLCGFELLGTGGSLDGVSVTVAGLRNIAVVNGSIRSWGDVGVDLLNFGAINCRVADLLARDNAGHGISAGHGSTVSNCSAYANGVDGINTGVGCTVSNCSTYVNTGSGISTSTACTVSNCSAYGNTGDGISTSTACTVSNCSATSNTGDGISVDSGCTVSNCSATNNTDSGIGTSSSCTVADCTVRSNTLDGIVCSSYCVIRGNTCAFNGFVGGDGAGIHATSGDNRIEGNNCTLADRGIDVDLPINFITRNTCSRNTTNWDVVAGNVCLVVRGVAGPAILGDAGGVAPGSTDPNANFTY